MPVGIESINAYLGQAVLNSRTLFTKRGLDLERFDNLMMLEKSVCLPCEDPVSYAVNAAKPLIDRLSSTDLSRIELLITSTESGLDFGKSLSTYVHDYLGLNRRCRLFEIKQACYGGTAALQMAANFIASNASPGAKALVVATDVLRGAHGTFESMAYAEPAAGVGSVAMLIGAQPDILELDFGANGFHGYEVMDTCRPDVGVETGDADLSLLSYLDCLEASYSAYQDRVGEVDLKETFHFLAFHTPFAGMVKGAHRNLMRKFKPDTPENIQLDFDKRVTPSLNYCMRVGNIFGGTLYLALCSLIDNAQISSPRRIGLYSYGSGCASEFFSGVITPQSQSRLAEMKIDEALKQRYSLTWEEYEHLLKLNSEWLFGIKDKTMDFSSFSDIYEKQLANKGLLTLKAIDKNYHRQYQWN
ncbi:MAG: hydroxymethylglutaryl-CoA synthase family protein [Legionella sp.]|nr:hydroxymethylglutaryl-CoA synthase family protein [Legionella sp.]